MSPVKQVVISSKKEVKCKANHIFMPLAQMATFVWSYHFAGTNAYVFPVYFSYTQVNLTFAVKKNINREMRK